MPYSPREQHRLYQTYGPWAVVTGASSGMGRALAVRLAEAGFSLLVVARSAAALDQLQDELATQYEVTIRPIVADLATAEGVATVLDQSQAYDVGLYVGAAGFGLSGPALQHPRAAEAAMVRLNCEALLTLAHGLGERMVARGRGGVILFSSIVAFQGAPTSANYAATKAYVQSLAEGLYHEWKPLGIDVLSAAPGPVHSGFEARAGMEMSRALQPEQVVVPILKALGRRLTVYPGWLSAVLAYAMGVLPRAIRVRLMGVLMGGMSKEG